MNPTIEIARERTALRISPRFHSRTQREAAELAAVCFLLFDLSPPFKIGKSSHRCHHAEYERNRSVATIGCGRIGRDLNRRHSEILPLVEFTNKFQTKMKLNKVSANEI